MIVGGPGQTETALLAGEIPCAGLFGAAALSRARLHPDRARLGRCASDRAAAAGPVWRLRPHPGPVARRVALRRADAVEVIGTALVAKAAGNGYRAIAALPGPPLSTVRRWLRRVPETHAHWLYAQAVKHAFRLNPDILVRPKQRPSLLGWSLNILARVALAYRHRVDPELPPWTLIGHLTRGNLLSPPPAHLEN